MNSVVATVPRKTSRWSLVWALLLILLSLLALACPFVTSLWVLGFIGCLCIVSSITQAVHAFHSKGVGDILWKLFVAFLYFGVGVYLLLNPLVSLTSLTLVIGFFFLAEGVLNAIEYFRSSSSTASGWILFDGIVSLVLGAMILRHWPSSSLWAFGTLIGIGMLVTGVSRLMISFAVCRLSEATRYAH